RLRAGSLLCGTGSDTARSMGSVVLAGHESIARFSPYYRAPGFSDCAAADDQRFRFAVQRHFDGLRDFGLGTRYGISRAGKCVGPIFAVRRGGVFVLPGDEFANGAPGPPA